MRFISKALAIVLMLGCIAVFCWGEELEFVVTDSRIPTKMTSLSAVYDGDDSIYVIGGYNGRGQDQVVKYSLDTGDVEVVGTFLGLYLGTAIMHGEDILYFGGSTDDSPGYSSSVYSFSTRHRNYTLVGSFSGPITNMAISWDSVNKVAYIFGGTVATGSELDHVFSYNAINHQVDQVATLLESRTAAGGAWANGAAYAFGGFRYFNAELLSDILKYDPVQGSVSTLPVTLPHGIEKPCAVFADQQVYLFGRSDMLKFSPSDNKIEPVQLQWSPTDLQYAACVHVPKLHRIYIIGGYGRLDGEMYNKYRDEISYIDLSTSEPTTTTTTTTTEAPPVIDCSGGGIRIIPDPFCCDTFYICNAGVPNKFHCEENLQFNPATLQCEHASLVQCRNTYGW